MTAIDDAAPDRELALADGTDSGPVLHQVAGDGVLARYGDLMILCDPEPRELLKELLQVLNEDAAAGHGARHFSRRLASVLGRASRPDAVPSLCAFGPDGDDFAVLVHGDAEARLVAPGTVLELDGRGTGTALDRIVSGPVESVRAVLGERGPGDGSLRWGRLDAGVVRAGGLVYENPPDRMREATDTADPTEFSAPRLTPGAGVPPGAPPPVATAPVVAAQPAGAGPATAAPVTPSAPPAPIPEPAPTHDRAATRVRGTVCQNQHVNDPRLRYCAVCGISMVNSDRVDIGVRPPLGVLVLDDGSTVALLRDCVLGGLPHADPSVAADLAEPVTVPDPLVAGQHARVELRDWQVRLVDLGTGYGTFVSHDHMTWMRLAPWTGMPLVPGSVLAIGGRRARYHTYRNV